MDSNATTKWTEIPEKMEDKLTGHYFLRTNLIDQGPKELWTLYNTLRGVEDVFRFMKSSLGLRPVYHRPVKSDLEGEKNDRLISRCSVESC